MIPRVNLSQHPRSASSRWPDPALPSLAGCLARPRPQPARSSCATCRRRRSTLCRPPMPMPSSTLIAVVAACCLAEVAAQRIDKLARTLGLRVATPELDMRADDLPALSARPQQGPRSGAPHQGPASRGTVSEVSRPLVGFIAAPSPKRAPNGGLRPIRWRVDLAFKRTSALPSRTRRREPCFAARNKAAWPATREERPPRGSAAGPTSVGRQTLGNHLGRVTQGALRMAGQPSAILLRAPTGAVC